MAIEKNMPESPTAEEQNRVSPTGLATAVAETPNSSENLESSKRSEQDKKDSEQKQVELEFKVFQAQKDKELAKKAKKLAKERFEELQNTHSSLSLSKLEQSFVKMLAPDLFAYIDSEYGNLLGTLSTAKKQDPYEAFTQKSPETETIKTESLDGKDFIVTYDSMGNQTSMELLDPEYVVPESQEINVETIANAKIPSVPEGSRTQLMQSLAQELGLRSKYYDVVEKDGKYVAVINKDKVLDALNNKEIDLATVKDILEQNNEHFSGETAVTPEPETKATQHDLAQAIQTGFFGAEKVLKYRTNNQGFLEIELLDENTGKTRFISSESAQPKDVGKGVATKINLTPDQIEKMKRMQEELRNGNQNLEQKVVESGEFEEQNKEFGNRILEESTITDPITGKKIYKMGGGALTPPPPTPPPGGPPAPPGGEPPEPIFTTNGNTFRSIDPRTGRVLSESGFRDTMADRGTDIPGVIDDTDDTEDVEKAVNEYVIAGVPLADARKRVAEMQAEMRAREILSKRQERRNVLEVQKFDREWQDQNRRQELFNQARTLFSDLPTGLPAENDLEAYHKARFAAGLFNTPRNWQEVMSKSPFANGEMPQARENQEGLREMAKYTFDYLYKTMPKDLQDRYKNPRNLKDLSPQDQDYFLHHLPEGLDLNTVIRRILANPQSTYPGAELATILKVDQDMGLGGALVRLRVEQLVAVEEFDEDKQMREGNIGSLIQGIGQFLSAEPELQHDLRVEVFTRMKLHETTIIARYLGVDKLADQMSNFYQDEFQKIMNTRLFREASMMLESENGAYFRKGRGLESRDEQIRAKNSERYEATTLKMALLLIPNLTEDEWKSKGEGKKEDSYSRQVAIDVARRFVEEANINRQFKKTGDGDTDYDVPVLADIINRVATSLTNEQKASLKKDIENRSAISRLAISPSLLGQAYKELRLGFDAKKEMDKQNNLINPMGDVIDAMVRAGKLSRLVNNENGEVNIKGRQDLLDVFNEANRAFGLSNRVADIYGTATRYDGLLDTQGRLMTPTTAILTMPKDFGWKHIEKNDVNVRLYLAAKLDNGAILQRVKQDWPEMFKDLDAKIKDGKDIGLSKEEQDKISDYLDAYLTDPVLQTQADTLMADIVKKYKGVSVNLADKELMKDLALSEKELQSKYQSDSEKLQRLIQQKRMLNVVRELSAKTIRDVQTRAIREMIATRWDEIDKNDSTRGTASKEYKKAMWNQIQLEGLNKDTQGKAYLRRYASTEIVALTDDNARESVLDQMENWNNDFQNMKKHNEELKVGSQLRKALIEKEPGIFNSTSKLNDPVESLKQIKDSYLTDWTQGHRTDYMNFLAEGVLIYIAKYNKENDGYKNTDVVREMNLMHAMVINSIITKPEKRKVEKKIYGGTQIARIRYGLKKGHWLQGIFEFLGEIFKESAKGLTK